MSLYKTIIRDPAYWLFITVLLIASAFFTYEVTLTRNSIAMARLQEASIAQGTEVTILGAVDGDEVLVEAKGKEPFVVRILGIKSFPSNVTEKDMAAFGKRAMTFLKLKVGAKAQLKFSEFKIDSKKRVLSYVEVDDSDIGKEMVASGFVLVYELYPFDKMEDYLKVEKEAHSQLKGLWGDEKSCQRALALKAAWKAVDKDV